MLAPITNISPLTIIHRERYLPSPGRVTAREGQRVNPKDIIADANIIPQHLMLDIAAGLAVPREDADRHIIRQVGDQVEEDDVIAGPVGRTKRVYRAPVAGKVVVVGDGKVLLEQKTGLFELKAGYSGVVVDVIPERGVAIEATGTLIQGAWGNGHVEYGMLQSQMKQAEELLSAGMINASMRGNIIMGGYVKDPEVLEKASDIPLRGLVLASMDSSLIPLAEEMDYPILLLEGFGRLPMSINSFKLLTTNQDRDIAVNAEPADINTGKRPELVIPLPSTGREELPPNALEFEVGQHIRVIRAPYLTYLGVIEAIPTGKIAFPSGLKLESAIVRLDDGEQITVPLANIEVLA